MLVVLFFKFYSVVRFEVLNETGFFLPELMKLELFFNIPFLLLVLLLNDLLKPTVYFWFWDGIDLLYFNSRDIG